MDKIVLYNASKNTEEDLEKLNGQIHAIFHGTFMAMALKEHSQYDKEGVCVKQWNTEDDPFMNSYSGKHDLFEPSNMKGHFVSVVSKDGFHVLMEEQHDNEFSHYRYLVVPRMDKWMDKTATDEIMRTSYESQNHNAAKRMLNDFLKGRTDAMTSIQEMVERGYVRTGGEELMRLAKNERKNVQTVIPEFAKTMSRSR